MNKDYFIEELTKLDITLEDNKLNKLEEYYSLLEEENKKYNLTRIIDKQNVYLKQSTLSHKKSDLKGRNF